MNQKIKVTSLDIVVSVIDGKPYYSLKYKELGNNYFNVGYSSYLLENVIAWKNEYFDMIPRNGDDGWIPCSERLPREYTNVMVSFIHGAVSEMIYSKDGVFKGMYGDYKAEVINAWMPLPEPYREV